MFRNRLVLILLLIVLLLGAALRIIGILNTDQTHVLTLPLSDDAYYYFALGRNLAQGNGARVDALHPTTGFQPLWGFLVALPYLIFPNNSGAAIAAAQALGALVGAATAFVLFLLARQLTGSAWAGLLVAALWFLAPQSITHNLNGMETALAILTSSAIFYALTRLYDAPTPRRWMALGAACGIGFLARVDTLVLWIALGAALVCFPPSRDAIPVRLKSFALLIGCALLMLIPWGLFTLAMGKPFLLPESGGAVRALAGYIAGEPPAFTAEGAPRFYWGTLTEFVSYTAGQMDILAPLNLLNSEPSRLALTALTPDLRLSMLIFAGALLIALLLIAFVRAKTTRIVLGVGALWAMGMALAYGLFLLNTWFFGRYSQPPAQLLGVLIQIGLLRVWIERSAGRHKALGVVLAAAYGLVMLLSYARWTQTNDAYRWITTGLDYVAPSSLYNTAVWLNENVPPETRVGAFQSGAMGYYADAQVINLDGKVNADARAALHDGRMWEYVCAANIDYIADWPFLVWRFLMLRSANWDDANLTVVTHIEELQAQINNSVTIYRVNRERCP